MRMPRTMRLAVAVAGLVVAVAGCSNAPGGSLAQATAGSNVSASPGARPAVLWPAPPDPMARTVEAGLKPGPKEFLQANHVHAHLDVFVDGKPITVPAAIGIKIDDPHVRRFDEPDGVAYGGIDLCNVPCISPLHTHDASGIIHTESSDPKPNTLGEFFIEWGVELSDTCVGEHCAPTPIAVYTNGERYEGDPGAIELIDRKEIAIVIGTPPPQIPKTADFSKA